MKSLKASPWVVKLSVIWLLVLYVMLLVKYTGETVLISCIMLTLLAVAAILDYFFG